MKSRPIVIRADAGGDLGTGHVMRMLALAQAWSDRGGSATFAMARCPAPLVERLRREGFDCRMMDSMEPGSEEDCRSTVGLAEELEAGWVVLDGYRFGTEYQRAVRSAGFKVLCMDDYGHCDQWGADVVVNQNFHAPSLLEDYQNNSSGTRFLLGPKFALLRRKFRRVRPAPKGKGPIRRLMVTFGGVDPEGFTLRILNALNVFTERRLEIRVVAGSGNPRIAEIHELCRASQHDAECYVDVSDMTAIYQWAEGVVSASGSSCYEWLYFRRPAWVVPIADNQEPIAEALSRMGLANVAPKIAETDVDGWKRSLFEWLDRHHELPDAVVDGWGAVRLAGIVSEPPCWIRRVDGEEDRDFLYALANEPSIRKAGFHTDPVSWREHCEWLAKHVGSPDSALFVVEYGDAGPCGVVRFHRREGANWEVGISVSPAMRGRGVASAALELGMRETKATRPVGGWTAKIRNGNEASVRLFSSLGFERVSTNSEFGIWRRH